MRVSLLDDRVAVGMLDDRLHALVLVPRHEQGRVLRLEVPGSLGDSLVHVAKERLGPRDARCLAVTPDPSAFLGFAVVEEKTLPEPVRMRCDLTRRARG